MKLGDKTTLSEQNLYKDQHNLVQRLLSASTTNPEIKDALFQQVDSLIKQQQNLKNALQPSLVIDSLTKTNPQLVAQLNQVQLDVIHFIDKLFTHMLQDKYLHHEIKILIEKLRLRFFKIALEDNDLFIETNHPARLFFNHLTHLAILWTPKDPKTHQIHLQIEAIINRIIHADAQSNWRHLFQLSANQLKDYLDNLNKRIQIFEKRTRESEEGKAKANNAKKWAKDCLDLICDKTNLPSFVLEFFDTAWQHVMFLEQLKAVEAEQGESLITAKQLVVSLQVIQSQETLDKLLLLQPILVERLTKGLQKSSFSFEQSKTFLQLIESHQSNLIEQAKLKIEGANHNDIIRLKPVTGFDITAQVNKAEEITSIEDLSLSQWVDDVFKQISTKPNGPGLATSLNDSAQAFFEKQKLDNVFVMGRWYEILLDNNLHRCKLSSIIEANDSFLFVSANGSKLVELKRVELLEYFQHNQIKPLSDIPHFERAYQHVSDEAQVEYLKQQQIKQLKIEQLAEEKRVQQEAQAQREKAVQDELIKQADEKANLIKQQNEGKIDDITQLAVGSRVEILLNNELVSCRLAAKIASSGKYIFVDRSGVKIKECLEQNLIELYDSGRIKLIQKNDVFDTALSSLISTMRKR